ncbi:MAG: hypothetical protein ACXWJN_07280 [Methyloceanibacter sp.]
MRMDEVARLAPSLVERAAEIGSKRDRPQPEGVMLAFRGARDSQRLASSPRSVARRGPTGRTVGGGGDDAARIALR